jgi:hypothetical protein
MSRKWLHCVLGAGLGISAPAWSADSPAEQGWFLEANVLQVQSSGGKAPFTFDGEEQGLALSGGYAFTKHFAVQAGYYDVGEHAATDCPAPVCTAVPHGDLADIQGVSVAAIGSWRIGEAVEVYGKLGVLGWETDFTRAGFKDTDRGALVGAGVGIWATPRWRINVQYERADFDLESAGIGMTYRF